MDRKTLSDHIAEVKVITCDLLEYHKLSHAYREICEYLAEYHDYGKLKPGWSLEDPKKTPPHSPASLEYVIKCQKFLSERFQRLTPLVWYLILKHHGVLSKTVNLPGTAGQIIDPVRVLNPLLKNMTFDSKVDLVDAFGLFKIADCISAANDVEYRPVPPMFDHEAIKCYLGSKAFDSQRWKQQLELLSAPNFSLLSAYTGWGKTMASPMFVSRKDVTRVFFLFPTITAINQFYDRLSNLHPNKVSRYFYLYDPSIDDPTDTDRTFFVARNLLNTYVITSVDQFLLSFLQAGKYYTKRVMFRRAGIILDEVHILNPLMLILLVYFLKLFRLPYDMKFLGMSATLTDAMRTYLADELQLPEQACMFFDEGFRQRRRVMFRYLESDIESALAEATEKAVRSNVMIAVNTVEKAVMIGRTLRKEMEFPNVIVIHGRFMYRDRAKKEEAIKKYDNDASRQPHILVCTQVCEVSLDVSYDHLYSELAPLPSLVQRFGRVNRRGIRTDAVNVHVFRPDIKDPERYPYTDQSLASAKTVLSGLQDDRLSNEMQLITELNASYTRDILDKEIDDAQNQISFEAFQDLLQFFYSLTLDETELQNILSYRDGFSVAVLPHYDCIEDDGNAEVRQALKHALDADIYTMDFTQRARFFNNLKQFAVQVPIWWLTESKTAQRRLFPIVEFPDRKYSSQYGFVSVSN